MTVARVGARRRRMPSVPRSRVAALAAVATVALVVAGGGTWAADGPEASPCGLTTDKRADPTHLVLGDKTRISLTALPGCPQRATPLDVVLVLDVSGSMQVADKLVNAKQAARTFVERTDLGDTRVAVVSFSTNVSIDSDLTQDRAAILAAIDGLQAAGGTDIVRALDRARRVIERGRTPRFWPAYQEPFEVTVLLSDGRHNDSDQDTARQAVTSEADNLKSAGSILSTVCLGDDCDRLLMSHIASQPALSFVSPTADELVDIYEHIADRLRHPSVGWVRVRDVIPDNMRFLPHSAEPLPDDVQGSIASWEIDDVPPEGTQISYWLEPLELGRWPTNVEAEAEFLDTYGRAGTAVFPVPEVDVHQSLFVPLAVRDSCKPTQRTVDVVLLIDTSSSMDAPAQAGDVTKREAARVAARSFAQRMRLPGDRVAVLAFDAQVHRLTGLSGELPEVLAALETLPPGQGTRIDLALSEAHAVLRAVPARPGHARAVVLLTDGRPTSTGESDVRAAASAARGDGIVLYTVGLGHDVNADLLRDVAAESGRYYAASDAVTLETIYRRLANTVLCPGNWPWRSGTQASGT